MRNCIVCGRPIRKRTVTYWFEVPQEAREAGPLGEAMGRPYGHQSAREEKPDGHREQESATGSWKVYTSTPPKTKAEAQRFVNFPIISVRRSVDDSIRSVAVWDGESYEDEFFDTGDCAKRLGRAAARAGFRLK